MKNGDRIIRVEPTASERDEVAMAMQALEDYAISIEMPDVMFMSAIQAFATQNLSKMDALCRSVTVGEMLKVAANVYQKRVAFDPSFKPIRCTENGRDAESRTD